MTSASVQPMDPIAASAAGVALLSIAIARGTRSAFATAVRRKM